MSKKPIRVLIVDDNADAAELVAALVEQRGHHVRVAYDVDEGLRVAQEFEPQVALLDIMIRCESGFYLAGQIRDMPQLKGCKLVAMTGFGMDQHRSLSEAVGFRGQLSKPIDAERLYDAIEAA